MAVKRGAYFVLAVAVGVRVGVGVGVGVGVVEVVLLVIGMVLLVVGTGVVVLELGELPIGGGGKPGVTVNSSRLRAFPLPCELLKLMVMVLLP